MDLFKRSVLGRGRPDERGCVLVLCEMQKSRRTERFQDLQSRSEVAGMKPDDGPCEAEEREGEVFDKNDPMMPLAWIRERKVPENKTQRIFATTMGASQAFTREGSPRLLIQACYWCLGMEKQIDGKGKVNIVGNFEPTPFGFNRHRKDVKPADLLD